MSEPWFKKAFEGHYLDVYAHRNQSEAQAHLPQICKLAQLESARGPILDCGCGQGRYSIALKKKGFNIIGLDYSADLLQRAHGTDSGPWVRGNMLQLPFHGAFERILSLFTSFGYFDSDDENAKVLQQMSQALVSGGLLYLDYLNPHGVAEAPWSDVKQGEYCIRSQKVMAKELNMVHKDVEILMNGKLLTQYQERVKLYGENWFRAQAEACGLEIVSLYGDYFGGSFERESARQIYVLRKR